MRDTLATVSRIAFPPQALCYGCPRRPDEDFDFSLHGIRRLYQNNQLS
jgi:hypothetical protein